MSDDANDDDATPKLSRPLGKRFQSQTERDVQGMAARRERGEREREVFPVYVVEEATGNHSGEDLAAIRARRPTPQRIGHIEERVDGVVETIGEMRADVARDISAARTDFSRELGAVRADFTRDLSGVTTALANLGGDVRGLAQVVQERSSRDHVTFTAQVDVDKERAVAQVDVAKAKELDVISEKKSWRKWISEGPAIVVAALGLLAAAFAAGRC